MKKANPTLVGTFIVVGVALGVAALFLFSSSKLFTKKSDYIAYFNESLNGLSEGAPVKIRGVTVGSVKRVMIHYNQAREDTAMPVIIEIQHNLLAARLGPESQILMEQALTGQISTDLRAVLKTESLLTGVLYIDVEKSAKPAPPVYHQIRKIYPEVPTQPTQIQRLMENLSSLDIKGLETKLTTLITHLDSSIAQLKVHEINASVTNVLSSADRLVASPQWTNLMIKAEAALEQYRLLGQQLNSRVPPLADSATNTLAEASHTLLQLRGSAQDLSGLIAPDSALQAELARALDQLAQAAQAIAALSEFLQEHPNALISGRRNTEPTETIKSEARP